MPNYNTFCPGPPPPPHGTFEGWGVGGGKRERERERHQMIRKIEFLPKKICKIESSYVVKNRSAQ